MSSLVTVEARGPASVASAAWRHRGNIRATVVVKSEFSFVDGVLTQVPAQPVQPDTEMAFVLVQAEALFAGLVPHGDGPARIGIWRGSQALINHVVQPGLSSTAIGGRISPFAPTRTQHLNGFSAAALRQPFVELPDTFDTAFFQSAAPGLRLAGFAGGDAVVVENLYPGHHRLVLRLPTVHVSGTGRMGDRATPIRFNMDTVFIDAQSHRCTVLWRGRLAASNPEALSQATASVELGVTDPGGVEGDLPPPWPKVAAVPASPFGEGTVDLGKTAIEEAAAMTATPFAKSSSNAPRSAPPSEQIPGAPWAGGASEAPPVQTPEGITETVGILDVQDQAASSGNVKLPPGIRKPKAVSAPPMVVAPTAPAAVPAPVAPQPDHNAHAEAEAQAERMRSELEQKRKEHAEAEERRRQDAERFAAEQKAAAQAEADRKARKIEESRKKSERIKTSVYKKFGKKR